MSENNIIQKNKQIFDEESFLNILEDMENDKREMSRQRAAILNILEDTSEAQEKLKISKMELEDRQTELEALIKLNEELARVLSVEEAVDTIKKYLWEVLNCDVCTFLIYSHSRKEKFIFNMYTRSEISEKFALFIENELKAYLLKKSEDIIVENLKNKQIILDKKGATINKKNKKPKPAFNIVLPLKVGKKIFGAIHLSFSVEVYKKMKEKNLIKAIVTTSSVAIDRLENLILSQQSKTESLIKSLTNGVIMMNNDKKIVLLNPPAKKFLNLQSENFGYADLIQVINYPNIKEIIDMAYSEGNNATIKEFELESKYYEIFIVSVKDFTEKIVGVAFIMQDITQRKKIDQMKSEFVSVASHQLRTPLTAIKLFTDMLVKEEVGKLNKDQREYLDNIYQSSERMARLVNDLLNVTRIESGRLKTDPQPTDLSNFVENIIAEAKPLAESKKCTIVFNRPKIKIKKVPLDQNLMRQVVHNLIVNAIRYSNSINGKTKVSIEKQDKENFIIKVEDNGIGIPEDVKGRIFEKFFRADNAIKSVTAGTGLGLYVSKMIVVSSGGKIWFKSKQDKGTTFFVSLPMKGMTRKEGERGLAIS